MEPAHNNSFPLTEPDLIRFLRMFRKHSVLWDSRHPLVRKKTIREKALENIVQDMAIPGFNKTHANRKLRTYRDMYFRVRNKSQKTHQPWFHELKFLDEINPHTKPKRNQCVTDDEVEMEHECYVPVEESVDPIAVKNVMKEEGENQQLLVIDDHDDTEFSTEYLESDNDNVTERFIEEFGAARTNRQIIESIEEKQEEILRIMQGRENKNQYLDNFMDLISGMLRVMPRSKSYELLPKIVTMILETHNTEEMWSFVRKAKRQPKPSDDGEST